MNIEIEPAYAHDAEALADIQRRAFRRLYDIYHDDGSPFLRGADEILRWLERPDCKVFRIFADGSPVGGIAAWERTDLPGEYYLARVYVLPEMQNQGIASRAISLCEAVFPFASRWTLDYPVGESANRRCYEKAGYVDTGERREQSGGAITLAYMEKRIPAFRDMSNHLDNPTVQAMLAGCLFDSSLAGIERAMARYRGHPSRRLYGWVENGEILGVCGIEVHADHVEVLHIAVAEQARRHGIGRSMLSRLQEQYGRPIEAETVQERQSRLYPIILSEHNPVWAEWFRQEKEILETRIGVEHIARIHHIGSTAVPGLVAKPTVDILLEIRETAQAEDLIAALSSPEYICLNPPDMPTPPPHLMFLKGYLSDGFDEKVYHIHVRYPGDWDELHFRDYLISHPETAAEYANLKRRLFQEFEHDRNGYTAAKTSFIKSVTRLARESATEVVRLDD